VIAECCGSPERRSCQCGGAVDAFDAPVTHLEEKRLREYAVPHDEWMIRPTHGRGATERRDEAHRRWNDAHP
jgi:hypothetical protein